MNGLKKDTWLKFFAADEDSQRAGSAIFDLFENINTVVTAQPKICGKRFVTRFQIGIVIALLVGVVIGVDFRMGWAIFGKLFL